MKIDFPRTREAALIQWEKFLPRVADYNASRNLVAPGHPHVSRLSPAIRCRLITEEEIIASLRDRFPFHQVEKFVQEVLWRGYWKAWLERNPGIWHGFRRQAEANFPHLTTHQRDRAEQMMRGQSGVAVMDHFAHELVETGYLHNHARMWWASYWIHFEQLPWQLGADFFHRHLLDGDPASNTLSWRWVAGLQTRGKTYVVRRSNIEKYLSPDLLNPHGLELLDQQPTALVVDDMENAEQPTPGILQEITTQLGGDPTSVRWGLWLHEEDLHPEDAPLPPQPPIAIFATFNSSNFDSRMFGALRLQYLKAVLEDGLQRATSFWNLRSEQLKICTSSLHTTEFISWIQQNRLEVIYCLQPFTGLLTGLASSFQQIAVDNDAQFITVQRPFDSKLKGISQKGFFPFWAHAKQMLEW